MEIYYIITVREIRHYWVAIRTFIQTCLHQTLQESAVLYIVIESFIMFIFQHFGVLKSRYMHIVYFAQPNNIENL